jgi:hypothetical protein
VKLKFLSFINSEIKCPRCSNEENSKEAKVQFDGESSGKHKSLREKFELQKAKIKSKSEPPSSQIRSKTESPALTKSETKMISKASSPIFIDTLEKSLEDGNFK